MVSIFDKRLKGVRAPHCKNTMDHAVQKMPIPDKVSICMSQHMGPPCGTSVKPGEEVKVGQVIGEPSGFFGVPIHSSVSGKVTGIEEIIMPGGIRTKTVVIETDKAQTYHESVQKPEVTDRESFLKAVRDSGLVGLGGAGFPTHIKFNPPNLDAVDTLIVNGAECEPYITSDYRTMMERGEDVALGIEAVMKHLGIPNCIIGIEDNKPKAIERMNELTKGRSGVRVLSLSARYPQGAEKVLIHATTGRVVPEGKLPADVNCIVSNITTLAQLARYLKYGLPLIDKWLTVDGGAIANPQNVQALIGTPAKEVIAFCGGYSKEPRKLLMGGPMMGIALYNEDYPILKNNNAILAFDESQVEEFAESACIRCGRCVRACPVNLMPLRIEDAFIKDDYQGLQDYKVNLCIECGCCAYVCPAKRHLVQTHRLSKAKLRQWMQEQNKKEGGKG